jgi:4'-phosphopantetheinyl transferase
VEAIADTWLLKLDVAPAEVERLVPLLGNDEQHRLEQIRTTRDKVRFIVRRAKLRRLLADYLRTDPAQLRFEHNPHGKPALSNARGLCFNSSSSGNLGLCTIGWGVELGCDVERQDSTLASVAIADRFFAPSERRSLRSLPQEQWLEGFFNCWTRKEALLKCLGCGLLESMDCYEVSLAPADSAAVLSPAVGFHLEAFLPLPRLHVAVAVKTDRTFTINPPHWFD